MTDVPRDRWGHPLIIPPDGGKPIPYTRASSLGKTLTDDYTLTRWKLRQVALGLSRRPDLITSVSAHKDNSAHLNELCDQAMQAVGSDAAAILGTALHALTEQTDMGAPPEDMPPAAAARIGNYTDTIRAARLEPVEAETFVVCDELTVAGTFDRLYRTPAGKVLVGDVKTGKAIYPQSAVEFCVQLAVYAHGQRYDPDTGERAPLHPDLDPDRGVIVHLPAQGEHCALLQVPLDTGWTLAQLAVEVLTARKLRGLAAEKFRLPKEA